MPKPLDPALVAALRTHFPNLSDEEKKDVCWLLERPSAIGGAVWIIKHLWVEKLAAAAGISVEMMEFISVSHESGYVACQVLATDGKKRVITTGEASPKNSSSDFPFATAEKRAVDRAVLKLLGMHGEVYSDEEMGDVPTKEKKEKPKGEVLVLKESEYPFEVFWEAYGHKVGSKHKCSLKWARLSEGERKAVMEHVPLYVQSTPDKGFRKHPETYLNGRIWESEELPLSSGKPLSDPITYQEMLREVQTTTREMTDYDKVPQADGKLKWRYRG